MVQINRGRSGPFAPLGLRSFLLGALLRLALLVAAGAALCSAATLVFAFLLGGISRLSTDLHKSENANALDIIRTLGCNELQEEVERKWQTALNIQRLEREGGAEWDALFDSWIDDFAKAFDLPVEIAVLPADQAMKFSARHLFCLAAEGITLPPSTTDQPGPKVHCDVDSKDVRDELLYLWSSSRSQMPEEVLVKTLRSVTEHKDDLRGHEVHLWYPPDDSGTKGMLDVLNSGYEGRADLPGHKVYLWPSNDEGVREKLDQVRLEMSNLFNSLDEGRDNFDGEPAENEDDMYMFHSIPSKFMGPNNKLFVDVGSALGLTSMLISYLYPGTTIVSVEPASPSWLIQNINFRCNLSRDQLQYVHPILAGVGTRHHDDNVSMMKMIWRPTDTSKTRLLHHIRLGSDMELAVRLRTLRAILAEADLPLRTPISVLNLDCEGCEYNLIPSMSNSSFNSVGLVLGRTNWGYLPKIRKPSSDRARRTHERVCTHYNFAKRCKECCDFSSLEVLPRFRDDDFEPKDESTVAEVAGYMCNGFDEWAEETKLHDIPDDCGWEKLSVLSCNQPGRYASFDVKEALDDFQYALSLNPPKEQARELSKRAKECKDLLSFMKGEGKVRKGDLSFVQCPARTRSQSRSPQENR